jgi:hypothetical protein
MNFRIKSLRFTVIVAVIIGSLIHSLLVFWGQYRLESAVEEVRFYDVLFNDDVVLRHLISEKSNETTKKEKIDSFDNVAYRILLSKKIVRPDVAPDELDGFTAEIENVLKEDKGRNISALNGYIALLESVGTHPDEDEANPVSANFLKKALANSYSAISEYENYNNNESTKLGYIEGVAGFMRHLQPVKFFSRWDTNGDLEKIKSISFVRSKVSFPYYKLTSNKEDSDLEKKLKELSITSSLFTSLLVGINTHPTVMKARQHLKIVDDIWQWLMINFFMVGLALVGRDLIFFKQRVDQDKDKRAKTNSIYKFILEALPVLGFMGTIYGLMSALAIAYKASLAQGSSFLSAIAIIDITNALSIAFTTTLVAFILKLVLDAITVAIQIFTPAEYSPLGKLNYKEGESEQ